MDSPMNAATSSTPRIPAAHFQKRFMLFCSSSFHPRKKSRSPQPGAAISAGKLASNRNGKNSSFVLAAILLLALWPEMTASARTPTEQVVELSSTPYPPPICMDIKGKDLQKLHFISD